MKRKNEIKVGFTLVGILFFALFMVKPAVAQSTQPVGVTGTEIPLQVMQIAEKSCANCHGEAGNFMAKSRLDFSKWGEYSIEKQAAKAKAMCKVVTKNEMPPKKFRKNHPETVPATDDIKIICDWAQSLQENKKQ